MPIVPTGNMMKFVETGSSPGTPPAGYAVENGKGSWSCDISFATSIVGDRPATITFDSDSGICGSKTPEIRFTLN